MTVNITLSAPDTIAHWQNIKKIHPSGSDDNCFRELLMERFSKNDLMDEDEIRLLQMLKTEKDELLKIFKVVSRYLPKR